MGTTATARKWENGHGQVRWQPELDGDRRWQRDPWLLYWHEKPLWRNAEPDLYRWRFLAVAAARREHKRRAGRFVPSGTGSTQGGGS